MTTCGDNNCNRDRESKMVVVQRNQDGMPTIWCDPCIAPLVTALNAAGLKTVASCCGHGRRPADITLADGREIVVARSFREARKIDALFPDDINERTGQNSLVIRLLNWLTNMHWRYAR